MESNRSGGPTDANAENKAAVNRNRNEKLIRLITVIAYFCSVSGAAVMLSLYYIFLWDPDPRSNHAAFQEPNSLYTSHSQLPNSLSSTSASPLLRHLIGNHTTVTGMSFCVILCVVGWLIQKNIYDQVCLFFSSSFIDGCLFLFIGLFYRLKQHRGTT